MIVLTIQPQRGHICSSHWRGRSLRTQEGSLLEGKDGTLESQETIILWGQYLCTYVLIRSWLHSGKQGYKKAAIMLCFWFSWLSGFKIGYGLLHFCLTSIYSRRVFSFRLLRMASWGFFFPLFFLILLFSNWMVEARSKPLKEAAWSHYKNRESSSSL